MRRGQAGLVKEVSASTQDQAACCAPVPHRVALKRPSIPPERLLRGLLLQIPFSVRSERQLMEQLEYNLLYRWFVGLGMDDAVSLVTAWYRVSVIGVEVPLLDTVPEEPC